MRTIQVQRLERFAHVARFCGGSEDRLASVSMGYREQLQALRQAVTVLREGVAYERMVRASSLAGRLRRARKAVYGQLVSLRRMARVMDAGPAGPTPSIGVPAASGNLGALLHAARQAVRDVTPHRDVFVAHGMPADAPERLAAAVRAVEVLRDERVKVRSQLARVCGERQTAFRVGNRAVLCLDGMVRTYQSRNPARAEGWLRRWEELAGQQHAPGRRRVSAC